MSNITYEYVALRGPKARSPGGDRCGTCLDLRRKDEERIEQAITKLVSGGWKEWHRIPWFGSRGDGVWVFRREYTAERARLPLSESASPALSESSSGWYGDLGA